MTYTLEDVPRLVDEGRYVDALRILYEANHPLSYELFPRKRDELIETPADIELSDEQISRLTTFLREWQTSLLFTRLGFVILLAIPFSLVVLGIVQLYQLFTTNVDVMRGTALLHCCHGVIALPIFIFLMVMLREMVLTLKSDNYGLWLK